MAGRPTLSFMMMTRNSSWRLDRTIECLRGKVDEIILGVDNASTDDTLERARRLGARVVPIDNPQGYIEPHIKTLFSHCSCDWVLRLDDDELLSTHFELAAIPAPVLRDFELIGLPRAWLAQRDPPLYFGTGEQGALVPQFRLMKRNAHWDFVSRIHTPGFEMKPAHVLPDVYMFHLSLVDKPASERQAQYDFYQRVREAPWNQTYLLDPARVAASPQVQPCPLAMGAPIELFRRTADHFPSSRGVL